ncbi:ABC transporter permease [Streptomyces sp. H27-C3]|uniref:ABC transporter permease n=1 Tax=Streptomyces sp. H27-C3 TaxID=3046305 RepID=UPI0024B95DC8|nr:ABC transporter permease [Streptomyces sp. H27-C3]MDJ0464737.1 ABC transporter permease [Streptomyces sp. H27-C3]
MAKYPGGTEIAELAALKALAQPRRQQILRHLSLHGPATSAILARALGLNTGACGSLLETGLRGAIATERYAAAPLVVSADQNVHKTTVKHKGNGKTKTKTKTKPMAERAWLPAQTVGRVRAVEGVRAAVPELTFPAHPVAPDGRFLPAADGRTFYGYAWASAALTPFTLTRGDSPKAPTDLVVDRGLAARADLAPGDRLTVQSTRSPRTYRITGIAAPTPDAGRSGDLRRQTSLFFSTAEAERLAAHPGQVTAIGVLLETGTDIGRLKKDIAQAVSVLDPTGVDRLQAEQQRGNAEVNYLAMRLVLAFTAITVVNALAMSVSERIREFAMLRLAGATRRQILRMVRVEALTVLLIAASLGTGMALAVLTALSVGMTGNAAPAVQPLVYATVVCAAGLLVLVATPLPGRAALKARPAEGATAKQ